MPAGADHIRALLSPGGRSKGALVLVEIQGGNPVPALIVAILLLGLLVFALMTAIRVWRRGDGPSSDVPFLQKPSIHTDPAVAELRARFARGEIGDDEYGRQASLLGHPPPADADERSTPGPA